MAQYKGQGDPDYDEFVPRTPIVITGRTFNPPACRHLDPNDGTLDTTGEPHQCVHDWRTYWGNQKR
ncbi:MAG: hypothetical protein ACXWOV_00165 [Isosphaeraceae bacterium]